MNTTRGIRIVILAVGILTWAVPAWTDGREAKYSGTVISVDWATATIVVEGMGPWQMKEGVSQVEHRTISVMPTTRFVRVERASGVAPSGWTGDFVESALSERQLKPGDWVTVTLAPHAERPTAIRIDVGVPGDL